MWGNCARLCWKNNLLMNNACDYWNMDILNSLVHRHPDTAYLALLYRQYISILVIIVLVDLLNFTPLGGVFSSGFDRQLVSVEKWKEGMYLLKSWPGMFSEQIWRRAGTSYQLKLKGEVGRWIWGKTKKWDIGWKTPKFVRREQLLW